MKVCFVSHSAGSGGAERSMVELVEALTARGVECAALLPGPGWLAGRLSQSGTEVRILPYKRWCAVEGGSALRRLARIGWNLLMVLPAALWLRRCGADVVYTNAVTTGVGAMAAALIGRPHVWHIRELGYEHNRLVFDLGRERALGLVRKLSAVCVANSHCVAEKYRDALRPTEVRVVYQGVELGDPAAAPPAPPKEAFRCVVVGSLGPFKCQEEAIRAIERLDRKGKPVELLIVGKGDDRYEAELREIVAEKELRERVLFLGELESAAAVLRSADAVVNCSRHEAFGRVTVEGMLAGKPVVGARSGGTAELIRDRENGFLYEPGDAEGLASILERLIELPAEARRVGQEARSWAEARFTRERFADEILACLPAPAGVR